MTTLSEVALAAILSLAREPAVDAADEHRLRTMASDIAKVVDEADGLHTWLPWTGHDGAPPLPFRGPAAREATALALVTIAFYESRFAAEVEDCRVVGRDHPSITTYQLLGPWALGAYSKDEVCTSPRLAAERALWVLSFHAERCHTGLRAFAGYASGRCSGAREVARSRCRTWERLLRDAGIVGSCGRRRATRD